MNSCIFWSSIRWKGKNFGQVVPLTFQESRLWKGLYLVALLKANKTATNQNKQKKKTQTV